MTMGEQETPDMVSMGLLSPNGEEQNGEVQEQVSLVLPRAVWKSASRVPAL